MPYRTSPFAPGEIYHIFNRSIASQPIFKNLRDYQRLQAVILYYRFQKLPLRFSHYSRLSKEQKDEFNTTHINSAKSTVDILTYCIMPNHFHFLLRPLTKFSISNFMRQIQNSYAKYFNTKYNRTGSLFQFMFKAVRIESDEQLLHVSRYIHLNPVTSYIIEVDELERYPWSTFRDYITQKENSCIDTETILGYFKSRKSYRQFVFDQADYQRTLGNIKHLSLE